MVRPARRLAPWLALALAATEARAQSYPNLHYTPDQAWQILSPDLSNRHFNQPIALGGGLVFLGGNAVHEIWDVSDPFSPAWVSTLESPFADGEAESHQVTLRRTPDGRLLAATISGHGVDLWDVTTPSAPVLLSALELENIAYGDNTNAVWGVTWQGDALYAGGTNTGLHVVDTSDPTDPVVVVRLATAAFGGVSAGPLFAVGNLLVITSPKDHRGMATLDIGDPWDPALLDFEIPADDTYIGGFYEGRAYTVDPLGSWDVTTDPTDIRQVMLHPSFPSEYLSFGDGYAFVGGLRPNPGIHKVDLADPAVLDEVGFLGGRTDVANGVLNDDQFSLPVGNLLVMCDDEIRYGCVLGVHDLAPDGVPPVVAYANPPDGAVRQPITTRIGLSLSDQVDPESVDPDAVIVRPLTGGPPLTGAFGITQTLVSFWPDRPLAPDTTYEIVVPAGGLTDLVGNGLAAEWRSVFSTGPDVASLHCEVATPAPVAVGESASLVAVDPGGATTFDWDTGDGGGASGAAAAHTWTEPGRYPLLLTVGDGVNERTCAAVQVVHRPLTAGAPVHATPVLVDAARGRVWAVNADHDTVSAVDAAALERVVEVAVGDEPRTLAQTADGRIWVANRLSDTLTALDPDTGAVVATVPLRWGAAPFGVAARGDDLWVTLEQPGQVVRVRGDRVVETVDLGPDRHGVVPQVRGLAIDADGAVWASRFLSSADRAELYRVAKGRVETVALAPDPGPDTNDEGRGVPNYLQHLAVSPDGARVLVAAKKDNVARGAFRDGEPLDTDNTVRTILAVVDPATGEEVAGERLDVDDRERLTAAVYSPVGDLVFAVSQGTNQVDVFDAYSGARVAGFGTGFAPSGLALHGDRLYVNDFLSRTLSVFDVGGLLDGTDAIGTRLAEVALVDEEVLAPDVLLGKQIFYNANTREMNADGYLACATCHVDGMSDGQTWDFTDRGEGLRNTIDLRGKGGTGHGPVHWSANFDEIHDFENDIRGAFGGSGLMTDEDFAATADPLGAAKAGRSERLDALAAYVTSLDRFPRSPFRTPSGRLTEAAEDGRKLVERKCLDCHGGPALTDSGRGELHDVGTIRAGSGQRLGGPLRGLDTPTLLGLWATAPYLHDGSAPTLADVLDQPDHVGNLTDRDRERITAFLLQVEPQDLPLEPRGCGCDAGAGRAAGAWAALLLALAARRRRGSPAA